MVPNGEDPYTCYWASDCWCTEHGPATYSTAGWYEVAAVNSSTQLTLDRSAESTVGSGQNFALTAGLANTFVPPWGPWSTLQCFDCHASDGKGGASAWPSGTNAVLADQSPAKPGGAPDPFGPHGSGTKWNLRNLTLKTYPVYVGNGSDPTQVVTVSQTWRGTPVPSSTNLCLNCHRYEVYGDASAAPGQLGLGLVTYHFSRVDHPPPSALEDDKRGTWANHPYGNRNRWGIVCMTCHGGARTGAIHGENVGHGGGMNQYYPTQYNAGSYSGKRMLAGSMLAGFTRPSTTTSGSCLLKWLSGRDTSNGSTYGDAVDTNSEYGGDPPHMYIPNPSTGHANYDFESGTDP
jgi:cytochrome c553